MEYTPDVVLMEHTPDGNKTTDFGRITLLDDYALRAGAATTLDEKLLQSPHAESPKPAPPRILHVTVAAGRFLSTRHGDGLAVGRVG